MLQDGHACMDAEGRATQEARAEDKYKYNPFNHTFNFKKSLTQDTLNL